MREGNQSSSIMSSGHVTAVEILDSCLVNPVGNKWAKMFGCGSAFVSGVLVILLVEALIVMFIVLRAMEKKSVRPHTPHSSSVHVETPEDSLIFTLQGGVWIAPLPSGDVKKMYTKREKALKEKAAREQKNDHENGSKESKSKKDALKDYIHIAPVWRFARLQGRILHMSCQGVKESILLEGCEILAVSGSLQAGRKWAKKYPLKLHNGSRHIYGGSYDCLLYLETGWEKEAWCEVLRGAAAWGSGNENDGWYYKLKKEYQEYCLRVDNHFPFLNRVNLVNFPRTIEEKLRIPKAEVAANTKKRLLWKKLTRRSIKGGNRDAKQSDREDSKKASSDAEDASSRGGSIASSSSEKGIVRTGSLDELSGPDSAIDEVRRVARASSAGSNPDSLAVLADLRPQRSLENLEITLLCANKLFARVFFDLYHSERVVNRIRATLQRQLSKVPTPSYIASINCTTLDLGNSPPLAHNLRLLPDESDGGWGLQADVEYYGGAVLTIETRIDVRDSNAREKVVVQGLEQTLTGAATEDLLNKGLESLKTDFHIAVDEGETVADQRNAVGASTSSKPADGRGSEENNRKGWMQSSITNMKAMMSRVAEQVSQVPLALTIRVVQCKGTLQVRIKPPPTDRVWFSFKEMPALELLPEPCIGDHKINSGPLGALIVNQIKVLIRDSMVAPYAEDISYSWMISEAGNWLPRDALPLAFVPDHVQSDPSNQKERRETQLRREGSVDNIRVDASGVGPSNSLPGIPFEYSPENLVSPRVSPSRVISGSVSLPADPSEVLSGSVSVTAQPMGESLYDLTRPLLAKEEKEVPVTKESSRVSESVSVGITDVPSLVFHPPAQTASSSDSDSGSIKSDEVGLLQAQAPLQGSKRAKVLAFGKNVGTRLEDKRRSVFGKMRDRSQKHYPEHSHV